MLCSQLSLSLGLELSVLEKCPAYRDSRYNQMTEKHPAGPTPVVRLIHVCFVGVLHKIAGCTTYH